MMNDVVRLAQSSPFPEAPRIVLTKPAGGTAQVIAVQPGMVLDLQGLSARDIVLVHAGDRLIILFADQSALVLTGFYGADSRPIAGLDIDLGQGTVVPATQLAGLLPISEDPNLLPAAGPASAAGNPPTSGLETPSQTLDGLGDGTRPLDLLRGSDPDSLYSTLSSETDGGTNTVPTFGGDSSADVTEDVVTTVSGVLTIADVDRGEAQVQPQSATAGIYGTFSIDADGHWTYQLDNAQADVQALGVGRSLSEAFTVVSLDGTGTETITITILGTNDVPVLTGETTGAVTEDQSPTSAGILAIADIDSGESRFAPQAQTAGQYGTFSVDDAGHWTYQLDNAHGSVQGLGIGDALTETFVVWSLDGSASTTVTVTIHGTNDIPVADNDAASVSEDGALTGQAVIATDIDSDPLTYALVGEAPDGLTFNADGTWSYTPPAAFQALDDGETQQVTFQYVANDGTADSNVATVTLTVGGANDAPLAQDGSASVSEDGALTGQAVTASDVDVETLTYAIVGTAPDGLTFNPDGTWSYAPPLSFQALDDSESQQVTFQYAANDGTADSNVATVTITVTGANDVPLAQDGSASVSEDGALTGQAVTASDVDVETLSYALVGSAPEGLTFNPDGTWSYAPPPAFQPLDDGEAQDVTFHYVVNDGTADSNVATVTITVTGANDAPLAQDGSTSVSEDGSLTGQSVTATDVDVENLTYAIVGTAPAGLTFNADGTWSYAPPSSFQSLDDGETGEVTFQYKANDGTADSNVATVTIAVTGVNDAPVAQDGAVSVSEDAILSNRSVTASDVDVETLTYALIGAAPDGLTFNPDGTWSYRPTALQSLDTGESQQVTFQYTANDGTADSNVATVTITVIGANDAPVAQSAGYGVTEDTALTGKTVTATDVDGETLTYALVGAGPDGLIFNADGTWSYTPPESFQAFDDGERQTVSFQYKANDGTANSNTATVLITVNGVNDAPVAQDASATVSEDGALTGQSVTSTDVDIEAATYAIVGAKPAGLTFNADGTWSYVPPASFQSLEGGESAEVSFQFRAFDGNAFSSAATVTITVTGANDPPAGVDKTIATLEETAYVFTSADFGFSDSEGDALAGVTITQLPGAGELTLDGVAVGLGQTVTAGDIAAGLLRFAPAGNGNGNGYATFKFAVQDDGGTADGGVDIDQSPNTITLNVTAVNDAPSGTDKTITATEDTAYTFTAADFGFSDTADGNTLQAVKITQLPGAGTLTLNGVAVGANQVVTAGAITSGLLKFTSAANGNGDGYATLQFAVQDNGGTANGGVDLDQSPNTLTFNVTAVNDAPAGANKTVTALEDTAYTFTAGDFGFTDSDGNALMGVKITQLPGAGSLTLDGVVVTLNQTVTAGDIAAGLLQFVPAANGNGSTYATFKFAVQDNGGVANGGVDLDPTANTITMSVTAVKDAPILDASKDVTFSTVEDAGTPVNGSVGIAVSTLADRIIDGSGFDNVTDPDSFIAGIAIVGQNSSLGTWYYSVTNGATWSLVGSVSDTSALLLRPEYLLYFKPAANYSGTISDALTFRAWDISGGTPTQYVDVSNNGGSTPYSAAADTVSVTVAGANDAPIAQAGSAAVSASGALTGQSVTAIDGDGDALTYAIVGTPPEGLTFNADGTWSYTPPANYRSLDDGESTAISFQYKANDGALDSNTASVFITINGGNDAPVAQDRAVTVSEDGPATSQPAGATDVDVETLTYTIVGATPTGLTLNPVGGWLYQPPASYQSLDDGETAQVSFQYKANDGTVDSNIGTVTITITGANDAPVAQTKSASVTEDGTLTGQTVTATDVDGEDLTYTLVGTQPDGLTFNADGTWSYAPPASYQSLEFGEFRTVVFQYKANDGTVDSNTSSVTITINGVNDAPIAQDAAFAVSEDGTSGHSVTASDIDGQPLTYVIVGTPPEGLNFFDNGNWAYTPPANYQALDAGESAQVTFQYRVHDGTAFSNTATVTITINGADDAPVAQDAAASVSEDGALTGQSVTASGTAALTYALVGAAPDGLTFNPDGTWSYVPPDLYQSLDTAESAPVSFQYKANDGTNDSNIATVTITIDGANDAPGAQDAVATVPEDGMLTGQAVAASDIDVEDLIYALAGTAPAGLTFNADGTWSYDPSALQSLDDGESQEVTFQYTANDGSANSAPATVTITVTGANDAPQAQDGSATVSEDGSLTGRIVTASDVDDETLIYALVGTLPAGLTFNTDGTWSYTPPASFQSLVVGQSAQVAFQFTASDGTAPSNTATQTITITGANDAPVARSDFGTMTEDTGPTVFNVLANDTLDPDTGAPNTVSVGSIFVTGGSSYGIDASDLLVTVTADNQLQVQLLGTDWNSMWNGAQFNVSINYSLNGDQGMSAVNVLSLTMTGRNDAPVLVTTASPSITSVEDAGWPVHGTVGTTVSTLIDSVNGSGLDNLVDPDSFIAGIAIVGQNASQGSWFYSLDGGNSWSAMAAVSESAALVLRPEYLLYFKPNADYSGTIADALTFRAWDGSGGSPGSYNNIATTGGTSPYSTATDTISLTVTAANDVATITGVSTGAVTEAGGVANGTAGAPSATGDLNSTDSDNPADSWTVVTTPATSIGGYGTYTIDATGHWTYTLDNNNATVGGLIAGGTLSDTFAVQTVDGTPQLVTVTIAGADDAPVITGAVSGAVTEDTTTIATGALTVVDADAGQSVFAAQTATAGTYGSFAVTAAGAWTYTLADNATVHALTASSQTTETFAVVSADGTTTDVVITVNGVNDAPVLNNMFQIGIDAPEDTTAAQQVSNLVHFGGSAALRVTDADGSVVGMAIMHLDASHGIWSWSADNGASWTAIAAATISNSNALLLSSSYMIRFQPDANYNGSVSDAMLYRAWDQTSGAVLGYADTSLNGGTTAFSTAVEHVNVHITAVNDAAVITGETTGAVTEAGGVANGTPGTPNASGDLDAADVDNPADAWQAVTTATASANGYGTYTIDATGHWIYTLDNDNATVNGLAGGATLQDTFTVKTTDDTEQVVTVTITGANDAPVSISLDDVALGDGGFKIIGQNATDYAGFAVSSAGDINHDGYDDVLVGAYLNDSNGDNAGTAYVVYGGTNAALSSGVIDLDQVANGIGGFRIFGWNHVGAAVDVASAGDLNHDGYDDLLIGSYSSAANGGPFVVYGQAVPTSVDLGSITAGVGGYMIVTEAGSDYAGYSFALAGDVNHDGYDDLLVGAYHNDAGGDNAGAAYLIYGQAGAGSTIHLSDIAAGTGGFKITGENAGDRVGRDVASAGDVNGDGFADILVGAYLNGGAAGAAYLVYGQAAPITSVNLDDIALGIGGFKITGENASDWAGMNVASAGDINGDGYADILVGAYQNDGGGANAGAAYLVYGQATPIGSVDLDDIAAGIGGFKITGEAADDYAGFSVASAGDLNGDGYADILVGAVQNDAGGSNAGAAYVIYGGAAAVTSVDLDDVAAGIGGFKIVGEEVGDWAGDAAAPAGDVNGDGYDDLIVGANREDTGGTNAGAAYVIYGGSSLPGNTASHIAGADTGTVTEDVTTTISGVLTVTNPDLSAGTLTATTLTGAYGSFSLLADGTWTYTLDNANTAVQALNDGDHLTESFQVTSADGSAIDTVTVTIDGTDDVTVAVALVSQSSDGVQGNGTSTLGAVSADGRYVAFTSASTNLDAGDTLTGNDVYVRDLVAGTTTLVSVNGDGVKGSGISLNPALSADGRYIAFESTASNLVAGDTNGRADIFVRDLWTGTVTRASVATDGGQATTDSNYAAISADGLHVAFVSYAANLVAGDTNGASDIFVRDLASGTLTRVSVASDGSEGNGNSFDASLSADGRYVTFQSAASNLVADDTNNTIDIFVRDLLTGTTTLVSRSSSGTLSNGLNQAPAISDDGRHVVYQSQASNLVAGDTNFAFDVFVHDLATGETVRASLADDESQSFGTSLNASISADGRYVLFSSASTSLTPGDTNSRADVFLRDLVTGTTTMISRDAAGQPSDGDSTTTGYGGRLVSDDGSVVIFGSAASDLVADDLNGTGDIFAAVLGSSASAPGVTAAGTAGDDTASAFGATALDDRLAGLLGNDSIDGGAGNDRLWGDGGDDILLGGLGADILIGGLGADTFAYTDTAQGGDTIKDFVPGEDLVGLLNSILGVSDIGPLEFDGTTVAGSTVLFEAVANASSAALHDSAKLIFDTAGHNLYYDGDGGASAAGRILLAHLENGSILSATDIMLTAV